ncbi:MAG: GntR family transcriptional regulator [Propionibacteriaceae bacterium]|nr:GntR family transcriptional regulator [Propionibacteriaceae bacterium]
MSLGVAISQSSGQPIYDQIKVQVKRAILTGEVADGDLLPSVRRLAADLKISVMTATRAYSELESEGFVATVPGKGTFVAPIDSQLVREQLLRSVEEAFLTALPAARGANLTRDELIAILDLTLDLDAAPEDERRV